MRRRRDLQWFAALIFRWWREQWTFSQKIRTQGLKESRMLQCEIRCETICSSRVLEFFPPCRRLHPVLFGSFFLASHGQKQCGHRRTGLAWKATRRRNPARRTGAFICSVRPQRRTSEKVCRKVFAGEGLQQLRRDAEGS